MPDFPPEAVTWKQQPSPLGKTTAEAPLPARARATILERIIESVAVEERVRYICEYSKSDLESLVRIQRRDGWMRVQALHFISRGGILLLVLGNQWHRDCDMMKTSPGCCRQVSRHNRTRNRMAHCLWLESGSIGRQRENGMTAIRVLHHACIPADKGVTHDNSVIRQIGRYTSVAIHVVPEPRVG